MPSKPPSSPAGPRSRAERLAAELRANLERRKAQARGRRAAAAAADSGPNAETAPSAERQPPDGKG